MRMALSLLVALGPLVSPVPGLARPMRTRTVLAFDNSGSMRLNDPHRLAQAAAMLYVQLAKRGDKVGLVVFDRKARTAVPIGDPARHLKKFSRKLVKLRLNGATTDIGRALEASLRALGPPKKNVRDVVLLLTDGHVDLGRSRKNEVPREIDRILSKVVRKFRARGVSLYTIAFTPEADRALMDELARRTNGAFRYIGSANELHRAFSDLFAVASSASSLPVKDGSVVVDTAVKQTSLVMSKRNPGDQNKVITPDEEVLDANSQRKGVTWKSESSYDLVELNKPQAGSWQMKDQNGKSADAVAIIQDGALDLDVVFGPKDATVDDELQFDVQLLENGKRIANFARLKDMVVEATIEGPDRKRRTVAFEKSDRPGKFIGRVRNADVGHYGVQITAMSPALQREWRGSYAVRASCFKYKVKLDDGPPVVLARKNKECPAYKDLKFEVARHLRKTEPEWLALKPDKKGVYRHEMAPLLPGEKGTARLRFTGKTQDGYPVLFEPEPVPLPEPDAAAWMSVIGSRLAYINIPLLLFGGIGFAFYRVMKKREEVYDD